MVYSFPAEADPGVRGLIGLIFIIVTQQCLSFLIISRRRSVEKVFYFMSGEPFLLDFVSLFTLFCLLTAQHIQKNRNTFVNIFL